MYALIVSPVDRFFELQTADLLSSAIDGNPIEDLIILVILFHSLSQWDRIMSQKLKIIVVGPKGSGKTTLSNFLLGQSEGIANTPYQPTVGCRILENDFPGQGNQMVSVELWDASGDNR